MEKVNRKDYGVSKLPPGVVPDTAPDYGKVNTIGSGPDGKGTKGYHDMRHAEAQRLIKGAKGGKR